MDVLTEEELRVGSGTYCFRLPLYVCGVGLPVVLAAAVAHHEPWADEAQSWLLARDAGLVDLWTRLLALRRNHGALADLASRPDSGRACPMGG